MQIFKKPWEKALGAGVTLLNSTMKQIPGHPVFFVFEFSPSFFHHWRNSENMYIPATKARELNTLGLL